MPMFGKCRQHSSWDMVSPLHVDSILQNLGMILDRPVASALGSAMCVGRTEPMSGGIETSIGLLVLATFLFPLVESSRRPISHRADGCCDRRLESNMIVVQRE